MAATGVSTASGLEPGRVTATGDVLAVLCLAGFLNGALGRIVASVAALGPVDAVFDLFGISAFACLGIAAACSLLLSSSGPLSRAESAAAVFLLPCILLPVGALSWLGLSLLAAAMAASPGRRDAGLVLLALCINMAWGRWLLEVAGPPILAVDALLVGLLTGAEQSGNTVGTGDGGTFVYIAPACSSVSNISVAILAATLCSRYLGLYRGWTAPARAGLAALATVAINIGRIAAMVLRPDWFDWLHDGGGATVTTWVTTAVVAAACLARTGHGPARPA